MRAAVEAVEQADGAVGVLINNAGYSQSGAIETVSMDQVRRQFETNVFGLVRMTQLALPGMRRQGWGRIVNLSSMGGRFTFPGGGFYHATKHAVEAISDALRFEVRGFGVRRGDRRAGADPDGVRRDRGAGRRAGGRALRGVRSPRRGLARQRLRVRPAREARRAARGGRADDREGAGGRPAPLPLPRDPVGEGADRASPPAAGRRLGRGAALAVPPAREGLTRRPG